MKIKTSLHKDNSAHRVPKKNPVSPAECGGAFTLIELLVVIAIIAVLAAIAFPAIGSFMERGNRARCAGNLKTVAASVLRYASENNFKLPAVTNNLSYPAPYNNWFLVALDFTDEAANAALTAANAKGPSCMYCPSMKWPVMQGSTRQKWPQDVSYGINSRLVGTNMARITRPSQIILLADGATHEQDGNNAFQINNKQAAAGGMGSPSTRHGGGVNVAWCDGHVSWEDADSVTTRLWDKSNNTNWVP